MLTPSLSDPTAALPAETVRDLIARYDAHAPRYTSYPTAAQFTADVDGTRWGQWLATAPVDAPVSLYLHIPFCKRLCWYCGCNTRAMNRVAVMSSYVDLLLAEADLVLGHIGREVRVGSVHLGGGTPNMLPPEELERLMAGLATRFDLSDCYDIAAELDPEVLTDDWVRAAGRIGLSRASLGVQDLSPKVQAAVNRPESFESIRRAVEGLRAQGVTSLNLDLMYGLPLQTEVNVVTTLGQITDLKPDRIALFGYAHVPWMKPHQKLIRTEDLPDAHARFLQSQTATRYLQAKGWTAIGLDHFALPHDSLAAAQKAGRLRRNFQGYTTDTAPTLIGLGASAISRAPQGFAQNIVQERAWRQAVQNGQLPVARGVGLSDQDILIGALIERLMCDFTVDVEACNRLHGLDPHGLSDVWSRLEPFAADGLIRIEGTRVTVTPLGRPFVRAVCAVFDAHARPVGRHARVI